MVVDIKSFIVAGNEKHNGKYSYTKFEYLGHTVKSIITCPVHGDFLQSSTRHLNSKGCKKCSRLLNIKRKTHTKEQFIEKARLVHGNKYNYDKVIYINGNLKATITCKIHGDFEQQLSSHLNSRGCSKCAKENATENSWKYKDWEAAGLVSKYFDGFKVYVLRCWNENEEFYKIGKTYQKVTRRFGSGADKTRMPYNYEIVLVSEYDSLFTCNMEKLLQNVNKQYKYTPKIKFPGHTECFSSIQLIDCE